MPTDPRADVTAALAVLALAVAAPTGPMAGQEGPSGAEGDGEKLYHPPCPDFARTYTFDCYHDYGEVTAFLRAAVEARPDLASLRSIGETYQGRDIPVITITDPATGAPGTKPAVWVDGGIDADEVVSVEAALALVHRLVASRDPEVRELLRTRTFHVAPVLMPDANRLHHHTPIRPRDTSLRPWDDDGDGRADEDPPEDLDGDGEALLMLVRDPLGDMVRDEDDPRVLRERRVGDDGPFWEVHLEGIDNDGDGRYQEDRLGGVDPNRNYPGNWNPRQAGSGAFPASEPGVRAAFDFAAAHPAIAASQHFHSSGGVVLRPPSVPDLQLPEADRELYMEVARRGLEITGYDLATSVYDWSWPPGSDDRGPGQIWRDEEGELRGWPPGGEGGPYGGRRPASAGGSAYPAFGGSIDGMYTVFGVLAFANELYAMGRDYDGDGEISEEEQLRFDDEETGGRAFREFTPHEHPQLGQVMIGGWRKFGHNNPPASELDAEVSRNVDFVLMQAAQTPLLRVGPVRVEDLSGGVWRVTAEARNVGRQPTELTLRREQGRGRPVRVRLEGVEVLDATAERELDVLEGHSAREVSWVVRGREGAGFTVMLRHPKGGVDREEARLRAGPDG